MIRQATKTDIPQWVSVSGPVKLMKIDLKDGT